MLVLDGRAARDAVLSGSSILERDLVLLASAGLVAAALPAPATSCSAS